ncbi:leucine zipper protein 1 [Lepus europaeus]|uniref:leucine zipper protein 1 n=1 Tax=Lepus europaeus TaxID=9983 RepID=UPI002B45FD2A|nr:leucine zipper protein 1 [Lepus europaeus]XP_062046588.1 leucine zipper protein 1 [Lepus europaeus]XP_062046590.1 leucine zipper protein 1 [Lepus europaeus]XP_062046591.1 leucine zipper protein 1 [Lepus europaeus]XP_062046592.1 leucine zipper protein 1 [Lepus europaeus]XP_062046593.1 leucine zipper protein 1 [Lepus europaeus]
MAELAGYKDAASSRHLRFKLQSLSRRLDELEEATKSLQKAEDELLELQDKVIQAEGGGSSMLADIEALRQRVLKIEGKDEEIKRAEDLCQLMKEKLEEEEKLTRELRAEVERLQKRMADLEKLEEAFSRSKNDCTQLCLSLNEERNLTKKISSELEMLRGKVRELESSEDRLDKTEQSLASELEKLKALTLSFVSERKYLNEKEKENEKLIKELTQKLEQNKKMHREHARNASNLLDRSDLRIEDGVPAPLPSKEARRKGALDYLKQVENETRNRAENEKNRNQEDNKVQDLNQEIERLKTQIRHFESLEEELKKMRAKNNDLQDSYLSEQNKNKMLASQLEEIRLQIKQKELGNGEVAGEDAFLPGKGRPERTKPRGQGGEAAVLRPPARELSPQHKRERLRNKEFAPNNENSALNNRQASSPAVAHRRAAKASHAGAGPDGGAQEARRTEDRAAPGSSASEGKKSREQPSVLSRYPPAAQEHGRAWKGTPRPGAESGLKGKVEKATRTFSDHVHGSVPNDTGGRADKAADPPCEAGFGKRGKVPGSAGPGVQAADSGPAKAVAALAPSRRPSSEGLAKGKKAANGLEADGSAPHPKAPVLSKYPYSSRSQESILPGFSTPNKEGAEAPVAVLLGDGSQHEALRCRIVKHGGGEKADSDDDLDSVSLVTAKLVNTTITPEPEPRAQPSSREKAKPRGGPRTSLFENEKDVGTENESGKPVRASANATDAANANGAEVKSQGPFSPREALRSRAVIKPVIVDKDVKKVMGGAGAEATEKQKLASKPGPSKVTSSITIYPSDSGSPRASLAEAPRERHTATSNIHVGLELTSAGNHVSSPFELSLHKHDLTLQLTEAERAGDGSPKNRSETVVSRSSILIKPLDSGDRNSQAPPAETSRWKSHSAPSEVGSADARHVTVRNAWKSRRDLKSLEDPPARVGKHVEAANAYTQRSCTDFSEQPTSCLLEQGTRRGGSAQDAPELCSRRTQSSLTASEVLLRQNRLGDAVTAAAWNHSAGTEEGEDSTLSVYRRLHNHSAQALDRSETPSTQGLLEPGRGRPSRPSAEDN